MPRVGGTRAIAQRASVAGWVMGMAGILALAALALFFIAGQSWGTINDLLLIVSIAALPVLMLAFWELGGLTPTPLALVAQVSGWLAAGVWCVTHLLFIAGVVEIDYTAAATGAFAVEAIAVIVIGLWIGGANLLAGPWLSGLRWVGVVTGAGVVTYGIGTLFSGGEGTLVYIGGIAYLVLLPMWAFMTGRYLARR